MAVDPEKAIEKLAQYRKDSKQDKKADTVSTGIDNKSSKIRDIFIFLFSFNVIIALTLGFTVLMSGFEVYSVTILWIFVGFVAFFSATQSFRSIDRLRKSKGRNTTIDDIFGVFVLMLLFFGFIPYFPDNIIYHRIVHVALVIFWIVQIYFVNYRKPDYSTIKTTEGGKVQISKDKISRSKRMKNYLSIDKLKLIVLSLILAVLISLPQFFM